MNPSPDDNRSLPVAAGGDGTPVLPRSALERVLARATELQNSGAEVTEGVSEARIMEIAKEVGIDTSALRQALAEERARLPMTETERGFVLDWLGPANVSVQRIVPGTPAEVLAKLDSWMPKMESLSLRRRVADRMSWEPRHDPLGNFFRALGMGGRKLVLLRLDQVVASVTAVDDRRSVVRFDADAFAARRTQRTSTVLFTLFFALAALGAGVPLAVLGTGGVVGLGLAGLAALALGAGYASWRAIRRGYRDMLNNAHLRLEQLLDDLERGGMQPPPSLAKQVTAALLR